MNSLIKKIDEMIEESSLLKHQFYEMWSDGKLSLDSLPFGLMGVAGDLCVARRRRCPCITSSSLLDLPSQAPSANVMVFIGRDTSSDNSVFLKTRTVQCLFHDVDLDGYFVFL